MSSQADRLSGTGVGRFAPSTTGLAHPGTLLAALLGWLDARAASARYLLRLEDLDPERCRPAWAEQMVRDLAWLGLDFDETVVQSAHRGAHEAALDRLAADGHLYPCACSRADLRARGTPTPDGGVRYPGTCRGRPLPAAGWRASQEPLRARLPSGWLGLADEAGRDLSQDPERVFGDPIVRRRDGAIAYQLGTPVDDAAAGVTRVVRGHDLAASTATQVRLQELLGLPRPAYRHHFLLLEERGAKLAKLHGSVDVEQLRAGLDAPALVGFLAQLAGLRPKAEPTTPTELLDDFRWSRVAVRDVVVRWDGKQLHGRAAHD